MRITEADPTVCFELLVADRVDLVVVVVTDLLPATDDARFEQHPLLADTLDLLVPAGHRLAGRSWVSLTELAREPWIMDRPGRPHHQMVTTACAAAGFTPHQVHEVVEWDTGAALVAAGFGVALVPRLARPARRRGWCGCPCAASPPRPVTSAQRCAAAPPPSPRSRWRSRSCSASPRP